MTDQPYTQREIDHFHGEIAKELEEIGKDIDSMKGDMEKGFKTVHIKLDYTNGKVKKIIIAMVLLAGMSIGFGFNNFPLILGMIL